MTILRQKASRSPRSPEQSRCRSFCLASSPELKISKFSDKLEKAMSISDFNNLSINVMLFSENKEKRKLKEIRKFLRKCKFGKVKKCWNRIWKNKNGKNVKNIQDNLEFWEEDYDATSIYSQTQNRIYSVHI